MISTATAIVLTLLLVWAAATAVIVAVGTFTRRCRVPKPGTFTDFTRNEREEELRWAAIRFLGRGINGEQLQEAVCQATNCAPAQATYAIAQAIERTIDEPPRGQL